MLSEKETIPDDTCPWSDKPSSEVYIIINITNENTKGNQSANLRRKLKTLMKKYKVTSEQQEKKFPAKKTLSRNYKPKSRG